MLLSLLAVAFATAAPVSTSAPVASSVPLPAVTAAPRAGYNPIPCNGLLLRSHLSGKKITNASLAQILAEANVEHHVVKSDGTISARDLTRGVVDYLGCFSPDTKKEKK